MEDAENKLRELRAKRAEIEARREAMRERAEIEAEVKREEQALADDEAIEALEREHGPASASVPHIAIVRTDAGAVVVKRPMQVAWKRFMNSDSKDRMGDHYALVRACVLYPDKAGLDRILDELPASLTQISDAIGELAGFRAKDVAGK